MRKYLFQIFILLLTIYTFNGCRRGQFEDLLPIVEIKGVQMIRQDTGIITAHIVKAGGKDISIAGFAYDTIPNVAFTANQVETTPGNDSFQARVPLEPGKTYYIRAIAGNDIGYHFCDAYTYTVPQPSPLNPPCTLKDQYMIVGGAGYAIQYVYSGSGYIGAYGVEANTGGGPYINFDFRHKPDPGMYITRSEDDFESGHYRNDIFVRIQSSFGSRIIAEGGDTLYITKNDLGELTAQACRIEYYGYNNQLSKLKIKFKLK